MEKFIVDMPHDPFIFVVRHRLPIEQCQLEGAEEGDKWYNTFALEPFLNTEKEIQAEIRHTASLVVGPYNRIHQTIIHDGLIIAESPDVVCSLEDMDDIEVRPAQQEIFVTVDNIFYLDHCTLLSLNGEVQIELFRKNHGKIVTDLDAYFSNALFEFLQEQLRWDENSLRELIRDILKTPRSNLTFADVISAVGKRWGSLL